jgi:DNA-binding LacI/PurR family transcriptional regulator
MGKLAAETLLQRIAAGPAAAYPRVLQVEPELVIRQSTASARTAAQSGKRSRLRA